MSKRELSDKTTSLLERLPMEQLMEVADFADFLLIKQETEVIRKGVDQLNLANPDLRSVLCRIAFPTRFTIEL